jgi:hypothetical protein
MLEIADPVRVCSDDVLAIRKAPSAVGASNCSANDHLCSATVVSFASSRIHVLIKEHVVVLDVSDHGSGCLARAMKSQLESLDSPGSHRATCYVFSLATVSTRPLLQRPFAATSYLPMQAALSRFPVYRPHLPRCETPTDSCRMIWYGQRTLGNTHRIRLRCGCHDLVRQRNED